MNVARRVRLTFAALLVSSLALASTSGAQGSSPGVVKAPPKVIAQMTKDVDLHEPDECLTVDLARSDRAWAFYGQARPRPAGCPKVYEYSILDRTAGAWKYVGAGGGMAKVLCGDLKELLAKVEAPPEVYRDLKAAGHCARGN